jgi:Flp pilus assembly protein TadG
VNVVAASTKSLQHGQVIVWVTLLMPLLLAVVGLAIDGGVVFNQHLALERLASDATRVGAERLDPQVYYGSNGQTIALDPVAARHAALVYLGQTAPGITGTVTADTRMVVVRVERDVPLPFLRIIRIDTAHVVATAQAQVAHGVIGRPTATPRTGAGVMPPRVAGRTER